MKSIALWAVPLVLGAILVVAIAAGRDGRVQPAAEPAGGHGTHYANAMPSHESRPTLTKIERSEAEWKRDLTPEQFEILRKKGTERAFTGKYWDTKDKGTYKCAGCGLELFESDTKFDSGCGWPSFFKPLEGARLTETRDATLGMERVEITCTRCGGHLGHVFTDGPAPTGLRYCINSVSIDLDKADNETTDDKTAR